MFTLFGIPVIFSTWFFVILAVLGLPAGQLHAEALLDVGLFVLSGTVSILVHEFGHALVGRKLGGVGPVIHLHGLGGLCSFQKAKFSRKQDFFMTLAGPMAGFVLCLAAFLAYRYLPLDTPPKFMDLVRITFVINLVWSTMNLLPVLPLDGGRLLQAMLGPKRLKLTLIIGMLTSVAMIPFSLLWGMFILTILLGYFAYQHFKALQALGRRENRP